MDVSEAVRRRLAANGLAAPRAATPEQVAASLLAVQSQDVQPSAWSLASRIAGGTEDEVEQARAEGRLVRTHVLRTTWHDVARDDLRWLLQLTAPRVLAQTAGVRRELHLDDDLLATARRAVEAALQREGALPRRRLGRVLHDAGLPLESRALGHVLMHLELTGLICSGPRQGAWQTHALLDERVPPAAPLDREQAVRTLVLRFLAGHGPAAVQDVAWWSSLLVSDVRAALAALGDAVVRVDVEGLELWQRVDAPPPAGQDGVRLVQLYDEHLVAFPRSKHLSDPERATSTRTRPYTGVVLDDGRVVGSWGRTVADGRATVHVVAVDAHEREGLRAQVEAYGAFLGVPAALELG